MRRGLRSFREVTGSRREEAREEPGSSAMKKLSCGPRSKRLSPLRSQGAGLCTWGRGWELGGSSNQEQEQADGKQVVAQRAPPTTLSIESKSPGRSG